MLLWNPEGFGYSLGLQLSWPLRETPGHPPGHSDLYEAMKDVGLAECGVGSRVQEQSTAIGYLEARHRTLGWVGAAGAPEGEEAV